MFGDRHHQRTPFDIRCYSERTEALRMWPFLTTRDLDRIHSEQDLCDLVAQGTQATCDDVSMIVRSWMTGYFHRVGKS